jgi:putative transposase
LVVIVGPPSPPGTTTDVTNYAREASCRLTESSQSHFRTLKYRPDFPDRFGCIEDSRAFCQKFFAWYNEEHRHSGIELLTPSMVHYGQAGAVIERRQVVLDAAYQAHPQRFVRSAPKSLGVPKEVWINKP